MSSTSSMGLTDSMGSTDSMRFTEVTLGLGSNLGNRLLNLRSALMFLNESPAKLKVTRTSDVFETAPWGVTDQPCFLNACVAADCALPPEELLALVKGIEKKMGREETRRWGERLIDIDILTAGRLVCDAGALRVPHADMHRRAFVLTPLAQILPDWVHPVTKLSVADMEKDVRRGSDTEELVRICRL